MFELTQEPSEKEGQMKEKPLGQRLKYDGHEGNELIIMMIMEAKLDNNSDTFGGSLLALVADTLQLNIKVIIIVILFLFTLIVINLNLPIPLSDNLVQLFPG